MANSSFISKAKNLIIKEIIKDKDILKAISAPDADELSPQDYVNKYIFDFAQNPNTLETVQTFITIQIHLNDNNIYGNTRIVPAINIHIFSNVNHMRVDNIPKVTCNRNDYISQLLDTKLNGRNDLGISELTLRSNVEGNVQSGYPYREMIFTGLDLNDSMCEDE